MGQYCNLGIPADIFKNLFVTASIIYDDDRIKTVMNQVIDIITKFCRRIESRNKKGKNLLNWSSPGNENKNMYIINEKETIVKISEIKNGLLWEYSVSVIHSG